MTPACSQQQKSKMVMRNLEAASTSAAVSNTLLPQAKYTAFLLLRSAVDASLQHGTQTGSTAALFRQGSCQPFEVDPEGAVRSLVACMTPSPLKQPLAAKASAPVK